MAGRQTLGDLLINVESRKAFVPKFYMKKAGFISDSPVYPQCLPETVPGTEREEVLNKRL